jgi:Mg/Co/Ni transporter MgtE|tara:strand:+ start:257 stop:451 length:195 start_codon:yes stop_codon:yes gene_type:complete
MLVLTYPTTSELLNIILINDKDHIIEIIRKFKKEKILKLMKIDNMDGVYEFDEIIYNVKKRLIL